MTFIANKYITTLEGEVIALEQLIHAYNYLVKLVVLPDTHIMHYSMTDDGLVNIYMVINDQKSLFYPQLSNRDLIEQVILQTKGLTCLL